MNRSEWQNTAGALQVQFQNTAGKQILQKSKSSEIFGFPVHIKVCSNFTVAHMLL